jgi:hypothetical protein
MKMTDAIFSLDPQFSGFETVRETVRDEKQKPIEYLNSLVGLARLELATRPL